MNSDYESFVCITDEKVGYDRVMNNSNISVN